MPRFRTMLVGGLLAGSLAVVAAFLACRPNPARVSIGRLDLPRERVVLFVTGATMGNAEPCNCPGQPRGGFSRRQTVLNALRPAYGPSLLLDVGNMVQLTPDPVHDRYTVAAYGRLNYDAIALGDFEIDRGLAKFAEMAEAERLPLLVANATFKARSLGTPYKLIDHAGRKVLIVGVLGPATLMFSKPPVHEEIDLGDPAEAFTKVLAEVTASLGRRPDLVIVLAGLDSIERSRTVPRFVGADLAVLRTEKDRPVEIEKMGDVSAVYAPTGGRQVAAVVFGLEPGQPPRAVHARAYPVEQTLPRDKPLWELYQAYTYDAQQRTLKLVNKLGAIQLVPASTCGQCHVKQYQAWMAHKHGNAWATISREGRARDPHCMRCHSTGFGFVGGFRSAEETPAMANVGCQSCHQRDLPAHSRPSATTQGWVDISVCRICHTDSNSPDFDPDKYLPKAKCPKGLPLKRPE